MNSTNNSPGYEFEGFRLTFEHFMNINGEKIRLEEPIVAQSYFDRTSTFYIRPYVLNEILDRMKEEIYNRALKEHEDWSNA